MNCKTFRLKIDEFLEGELDRDLHRTLEQHLAHCSLCTRELDEWKKLNALVRSIPKVEAPENFETALRSRIRSHQETFRSRKSRPLLAGSWVGAAAALSLLVGGGLLVLHLREIRLTGPTGPQATRALPVPRPLGASGGDMPFLAQEVADQQGAEPTSAYRFWPEENRAAALRRPWPERSGNRPANPQAPSLDYVDFLVRGPEGQEVILRIPSRIKVRDVTNDDEFFYRRVSH